MTPGYVFARGSQLFDLIAEASRPVTNHPAFRVARWGGVIPRIPDAKFDALRHAERRNLPARSEEHTSELQSLMRISYAVFCLKKKQSNQRHTNKTQVPL